MNVVLRMKDLTALEDQGLSRAMRIFSEFIQGMGLVDLPLQGAYYT